MAQPNARHICKGKSMPHTRFIQKNRVFHVKHWENYW